MLPSRLCCALLAACAGLSVAAESPGAAQAGPAPRLEAEVRALTLKEAGRPASSLTRDARLAGIARAHSREMFRRDTLAHRLDGQGPGERVSRGHRSLFGLVAENVGMHAHWPEHRDVASALVQGWMASPGHRANILRRYERFEVGCYGSSTTMYCTQLFVRSGSCLAEPVAFRQPAGSTLRLRLCDGTGGSGRRISIAPVEQAPAGPGVPVQDSGAARLPLPAAPGLYRLSLWTPRPDDPHRFRIVGGPLLRLHDPAASVTLRP